MSKASVLREILARPGLVPAVGPHDALSARLIEAAGFPIVWSSSFTAAGSGKSLLPHTEDRPKCMLDIKGRAVLDRQLETLRSWGIHDIALVRGYRKEQVVGELTSLFTAEAELHGRLLVLYGDVLFERALLDRLLRAEGDIVIAVDRSWIDQRDRLLPLVKPIDLVVTSDPPRSGHRSLGEDCRDELVRIGQRVSPEAATGEFIGLAAFSPQGVAAMHEARRRAIAAGPAPLHEAESLDRAAFTDLLQALVAAGQRVTCVSTWKGWLEIDTFEDYQRAWAEIRS